MNDDDFPEFPPETSLSSDELEALVTDADHRPPVGKDAGGPGSLADES